MTNDMVTAYTVQGMTCQHCVHAISEEVGALDGVQAVDVDLATGRVAIRSRRELSRDEVAAAVVDAGYALVD